MTSKQTADYIIYTDGACSGNPGPGGWGVLIMHNGERQEFSGGEGETTNNRMELLGAITALKNVPEGAKIELHTDSKYVMQGITDWITNWKRNNWRTAAKKPVKNAELWRELDELNTQQDVSWYWVKGHAGHPENERADELARQGMAAYL